MEECRILATQSRSRAVVLDASIAICATEATMSKVQQSLFHYAAHNYQFYAHGVFIAETLYILCQKSQNGTLFAGEYADAIADLIVS